MILHLLKKDVLRRVKNPSGFLLLLALPLLFALLIGLAFGPSGKSGPSFSVTLLLADRDKSFASSMISSAFGRGELASLFALKSVTEDSGRALIDAGKASALLVVPAGFGDSLLHRRPVSLHLVKNPSESFGPKVAEETVRMLAEAGDRAVRIAEAPLGRIAVSAESAEGPDDAAVASIAVQIGRLVRRVSGRLFPPQLTLEEKVPAGRKPAGGSASASMYTGILSGISVLCLLFLLDVLSRDLHEERENKTLLRLRAGPAGVPALVLSKTLFVFLSGLAAHGLMWGAAALLFGIRADVYQLFAFLAFSGVMVAALTGVAALIHAVARNRSQAQAIAPAVILVFSMIGGAMMPIGNLPGFLQKAAYASPVFWSVRGLQRILLERAGPAALAADLLVLSSVACVLLSLSFALQTRRLSA